MKTTKLYHHALVFRCLWDCWNCGTLNVIQLDDFSTEGVNKDVYTDFKLSDLNKRKIRLVCCNCNSVRRAVVVADVKYPSSAKRTKKLNLKRRSWAKRRKEKQLEYVAELKRESRRLKKKKGKRRESKR